MVDTAACRKCGGQYAPPPCDFRKGDFKCRACRREYGRAYRKRRKEAGNPVKTGVKPPEYHKAYEAEYNKQPRVRKRKAERARERRKDPKEQFKMECRRQTRNAIARGDLTRGPCEVCGCPQVDAHHDDYTKPMSERMARRFTPPFPRHPAQSFSLPMAG